MTTWRWSIFAAAALAATAALADGLTDNVVAQLQQQGYAKVTISRTLLGRIRILGSNAEGQREIVLNPNTGEILRDYLRPSYAMNENGVSDATRTIVEREPEPAKILSDDATGGDNAAASKDTEEANGDPTTGDVDPAADDDSGTSTSGAATDSGAKAPETDASDTDTGGDDETTPPDTTAGE